MKFDPFGVAWGAQLDTAAWEEAVAIIAKIREAVGDSIELMIEFHGRFAYSTALDLARRVQPYRPAWCEEPLLPEQVELLADSGANRCDCRRRRTAVYDVRFLSAVRPPLCFCGANGHCTLRRLRTGGKRLPPWPTFATFV